MDEFVEKHSGELVILVLSLLVLITLLILVPKLLKSHQDAAQLLHEENLRALEKGQPLPKRDDRALGAAGRTASLVPMVTVCAASIVTCFLTAYKTESFFSVSLAVWSVTGVVSLAAITGGVALMGRLAQLQTGHDDEQDPVSGEVSEPK